MLALTDILRARRYVSPLVQRTPVRYAHLLSQRCGGEVYLKLENQQCTGSFKVRGALYKIDTLTDEQKGRGLVTASAGNHALGVAYAARAAGEVPATLFLPVNAPASKVDKLREYPCQLRLEGDSYEAAHHAALAFAEDRGATYVSAYDDPVVVAGQGTVGIEIMEDLPQADVLLVPIGGGGLVAGVAVAAKAINPTIRIVGVQPAASPAAYLSLRDGRCYESYDAGPTIADGLAGGFGLVPFTIARDLIDEVIVVEEVAIRQAVFTLIELEQQVVEGAGAAAIAPLLTGQVDVEGQSVVAVLTGGNIDASVLHGIMAENLGAEYQ